ncbi:hypothetical protein [Aureivirga sp. CE67]|uniref:hypothetical protein n=1 Tax=Aureivirga sp. CE67 TaxID=1788983 RepID=UPI0018C8E184|nr:hypothetical protein [Aureivirga sp. CE67]
MKKITYLLLFFLIIACNNDDDFTETNNQNQEEQQQEEQNNEEENNEEENNEENQNAFYENIFSVIENDDLLVRVESWEKTNETFYIVNYLPDYNELFIVLIFNENGELVISFDNSEYYHEYISNYYGHLEEIYYNNTMNSDCNSDNPLEDYLWLKTFKHILDNNDKNSFIKKFIRTKGGISETTFLVNICNSCTPSSDFGAVYELNCLGEIIGGHPTKFQDNNWFDFSYDYVESSIIFEKNVDTPEHDCSEGTQNPEDYQWVIDLGRVKVSENEYIDIPEDHPTIRRVLYEYEYKGEKIYYLIARTESEVDSTYSKIIINCKGEYLVSMSQDTSSCWGTTYHDNLSLIFDIENMTPSSTVLDIGGLAL